MKLQLKKTKIADSEEIRLFKQLNDIFNCTCFCLMDGWTLQWRRNTAHAAALPVSLSVGTLITSNVLVFLLQMTFEVSSSVTLLFDFWDVHSPAGKHHVASFLCQFLIPRCDHRFKPVPGGVFFFTCLSSLVRLILKHNKVKNQHNLCLKVSFRPSQLRYNKISFELVCSQYYQWAGLLWQARPSLLA